MPVLPHYRCHGYRFLLAKRRKKSLAIGRTPSTPQHTVLASVAARCRGQLVVTWCSPRDDRLCALTAIQELEDTANRYKCDDGSIDFSGWEINTKIYFTHPDHTTCLWTAVVLPSAEVPQLWSIFTPCSYFCHTRCIDFNDRTAHSTDAHVVSFENIKFR
jgi:hypothetical protein